MYQRLYQEQFDTILIKKTSDSRQWNTYTANKRYLVTCLRIISTPEVDKIYSKSMHVDAITENGEVRFAKECKHSLDIRDEIDTKGDKKHAKHEAKSGLNHKYYWVHK